MSTNNNTVYDIIVIGAGISGLSSAKLLAEKNLNVLVLEARNRMGGRTYTVKNPMVNWVDLGGAYIGRGQNHLLRLIKEFDLKMYSVNEMENIVMYNDNSQKRHLMHYNEMPSFGMLALMDYFHVGRLIDEMGKQIPADEPWNCPMAEIWDKKSFKDFIEENVWSEEVKLFLRIFIETVVTNEPWESSMLWYLWYIKQCGGFKTIFATTNGGQEFKLQGGTNQISERLADCIGIDKVLLNKPVHFIDQTNTEIVTVRTLDGNEYYARYLIMAIPPAVQQKVHYNPPLPAMRNQLIQRAPQGSVFKTIVYYEKKFWRKNDMCGSLLIYGDNDYQCPITYTLDDSKSDGSFPAIIGFLPGDKARKLADYTKEERLKIICESYAKAFGMDEARHPIHYEELNWMAEQYSGGCYTMTCAPGFLTRYGSYLRKPFDRLHYAGTETASCWSGYMNGAIQGGERAAREVLARMGKISEAEVNVEEPVSEDYPPILFPTTWFERNVPSAKEFLVGTTILVTITIVSAITVIYLLHL